ncbi:MAG: hypothetical protein Rubg2KO_06020 [Rubricoccaceae bacterium]
MRALSLFAVLALLSLAALPASAQNRGETQRLRPNMNSTVVPRTNAGEVKRITTQSRTLRRVPRLRSNRSLRANQMRRLTTRRLRTATPRLRTLRAPEGRFVRRNGSYFRVTPSRLRR